MSERVKEIAAFLSARGGFVSEFFCAQALLCDGLLVLSPMILIIAKKEKSEQKKDCQHTTDPNTISVPVELSDKVP